MMQRTKVAVCLAVSFVVSFLAMTAVTDYLARQAGFYDAGEEDSRSFDE